MFVRIADSAKAAGARGAGEPVSADDLVPDGPPETIEAYAAHLHAQIEATRAWTDEMREQAVRRVVADYRPDAVFVDPLMGEPLVGLDAIAVYKTAAVKAMATPR